VGKYIVLSIAFLLAVVLWISAVLVYAKQDQREATIREDEMTVQLRELGFNLTAPPIETNDKWYGVYYVQDKYKNCFVVLSSWAGARKRVVSLTRVACEEKKNE